MIVWSRRAFHSRGMGVQSPSAYRFIRYVVSEHYPYYAYEELRNRFGIDKRRAKLCRFYFRLSNFSQPVHVFNYAPQTEAYQAYIEAGCRKCKVHNQMASDDDTLSDMTSIDLARISLSGNYRDVLNRAMNKAHGDSVFVIEHIKRDKSTYLYWKELLKDKRVGITYDLYYCGVLFFDKSKFKQHYVVNF